LKIEFLEPAPQDFRGRVIVTFLETEAICLAGRGIDEEQSADLRHRLQAFRRDWDLPEMDVYAAVETRRRCLGPLRGLFHSL
jgi:hypothetical protein